jgi:hypothetical protein
MTDTRAKRAKVDDEKKITIISGKNEAENRGFLLAHHGAVRLQPRPGEAHDRDTTTAAARRQAREQKRLRQWSGARTP